MRNVATPIHGARSRVPTASADSVIGRLREFINSTPNFPAWDTMSKSLAEATVAGVRLGRNGLFRAAYALDSTRVTAMLALAKSLLAGRAQLERVTKAAPQMNELVTSVNESLATIRALPSDAYPELGAQYTALAEKLQAMQKVVAETQNSLTDKLVSITLDAILAMAITALLKAAASVALAHVSPAILIVAVPELLLLTLLFA